MSGLRITLAGRWLQGLSGALMALGALGHSLARGPQVRADLAAAGVNVDLQQLVMVVWHFGGVCMVLLGGVVMLAVRVRVLLPAACVVGTTYTAFGLVAWAWSGMPFFAVFTVLGLTALAGARLSCR